MLRQTYVRATHWDFTATCQSRHVWGSHAPASGPRAIPEAAAATATRERISIAGKSGRIRKSSHRERSSMVTSGEEIGVLGSLTRGRRRRPTLPLLVLGQAPTGRWVTSKVVHGRTLSRLTAPVEYAAFAGLARERRRG